MRNLPARGTVLEWLKSTFGSSSRRREGREDGIRTLRERYGVLLGTGLTALLVLTGVGTQALAQQGDSWDTKASRPTVATSASAGVIDGILYVVGGAVAGGVSIDVVEAYDPVSNTWTTKTPIPTPRSDGAAGVINGRLYVPGGRAASFTLALDIYDPVANSWSTGAPMLGPARCCFATGVIDGILYVAGGDHVGSFDTTLDAYDPVLNTWTRKAPMPFGRRTMAAGVIGKKLYVVGGLAACCTSQATLQIYDSQTDSWTVGAPLPAGRNQLVAGVISGRLYAVTGINQAGNGLTNDTFEYAPTTDTWVARAPIPTGRARGSAGVIDGQLYVVGGNLFGPNTAVLEVYTPLPTCVVPPAGLVSWWDGDAVFGVTASDIQDGNDGTLVNGTTTAVGKVGQAFRFDNVNDYIDFPTSGFSTSAMTIDLWFNLTSWSGFDDLVQHSTNGLNQNRISLERGNGSLGCAGNRINFVTADASSNVSTLCTTTSFALNTWYHIAATLDGSGNTRIYVNGVLEDAAASARVPAVIASSFFVGRNVGADTSRLFHGLIDEVEIYDRVLSASEIQAIFNADSVGKCKALFADFTILKAEIGFNAPSPSGDDVAVRGEWTLGATSDGIDLGTELVVVRVGTAAITIPAGSFTEKGFGKFKFKGSISGVDVKMKIEENLGGPFQFKVDAQGVDLTDTANPVSLGVTIGDDAGLTTIRLEGDLKEK